MNLCVAISLSRALKKSHLTYVPLRWIFQFGFLIFKLTRGLTGGILAAALPYVPTCVMWCCKCTRKARVDQHPAVLRGEKFADLDKHYRRVVFFSLCVSPCFFLLCQIPECLHQPISRRRRLISTYKWKSRREASSINVVYTSVHLLPRLCR